MITSQSSFDLGPASSEKVGMKIHASLHSDSHHGYKHHSNQPLPYLCWLTFGLDKMILISLLDGGIPLWGIKGKCLQRDKQQ